jgi:ABC-type Mn2+/Zn2+ transport system ATPase subunit
MTRILHIIGKQGAGKSTLARQIKSDYDASGRVVCENLTELGLHEPGWPIDVSRYRDFSYLLNNAKVATRVELLIIEHQLEPTPEQLLSGDMLIRIEVAA